MMPVYVAIFLPCAIVAQFAELRVNVLAGTRQSTLAAATTRDWLVLPTEAMHCTSSILTIAYRTSVVNRLNHQMFVKIGTDDNVTETVT